jgi:hypothetical protein
MGFEKLKCKLFLTYHFIFMFDFQCHRLNGNSPRLTCSRRIIRAKFGTL